MYTAAQHQTDGSHLWLMELLKKSRGAPEILGIFRDSLDLKVGKWIKLFYSTIDNTDDGTGQNVYYARPLSFYLSDSKKKS